MVWPGIQISISDVNFPVVSPPSRKLSLGVFYILFEAFYFHRVAHSFHFHGSQSSCSSAEAELGLKAQKFCVAEPLPPAGFPWYLLSPPRSPSPLLPLLCPAAQPSRNPKNQDGRGLEEISESQSSVSVLALLIACLAALSLPVPSKFNSVNPTRLLDLPGIPFPHRSHSV